MRKKGAILMDPIVWMVIAITVILASVMMNNNLREAIMRILRSAVTG